MNRPPDQCARSSASPACAAPLHVGSRLGALLMLCLSPYGGSTAAGMDFTSLCEIHTITSGPYEFTHAYPTARTFSADSRWLFVESPGPDHKGVVRKHVRHLLAIQLETGQQEYLVTIEHPDPDKPPAWMMFDYAPQADCLVFGGPRSDEIHMLNRASGRRGLLLHEPEGEIGGPLSIAWDGTRVVYWVMYKAVENRFFDDYYTVIFYIDVDPVACQRIGEPRIIEAYPRRKGPTWSKSATRDAIHVNHPQINPKNKDHVCYSHEMLGSRPDGSVARSRLWHSFVDERRKEPLIFQPAGLDFTHEVIAPDGRSLIFPYMLGVGQVFFDTLERRSIYYNPDCCPGHLTISPDGNWIAGDTWGRWKDDAEKEWQSIMMFKVATRQWAHIAWFYHSHPHPIFSQDGTKIAFSHRDKDGHQQVAWIDVLDVQKRWDQVAQGVGRVASPDWIKGVDHGPVEPRTRPAK